MGVRWRSGSGDQPVTFTVNGETIAAREGDTVASALLALGRSTLRRGPAGDPRGVFCGIGVCFDCLVTIDGRTRQRACMTLVRPGMRVEIAAL